MDIPRNFIISKLYVRLKIVVKSSIIERNMAEEVFSTTL